jgi:hypothetical protein
VEVERDADLCIRQDAAQPLNREAVTEQQVMGRCGRERFVGVPRGVHSDAVALVGDDLRLVERDPHPATITDASAMI